MRLRSSQLNAHSHANSVDTCDHESSFRAVEMPVRVVSTEAAASWAPVCSPLSARSSLWPSWIATQCLSPRQCCPVALPVLVTLLWIKSNVGQTPAFHENTSGLSSKFSPVLLYTRVSSHLLCLWLHLADVALCIHLPFTQQMFPECP